MKKQIITTLALTALGIFANAQTGRVGINTDVPKTTLDVSGKVDGSGLSLTTDVTGLQAPRLTRAELTSKGDSLYGTDQKGALVYITDITGGNVNTQRVNITTVGYYYFDGAVWQKVSTENASVLALAGDVTGTLGSNTVTKIRNTAVSTTAPTTNGQVLTFDGSEWKPAITTNLLSATNGNLVSTVNGVATTPAVAVLINADNGLTPTNGKVQLGGALTQATTITTDAAKTLALAGLQTTTSTSGQSLLLVDNTTGVVQKVTIGSGLTISGGVLIGNPKGAVSAKYTATTTEAQTPASSTNTLEMNPVEQADNLGIYANGTPNSVISPVNTGSYTISVGYLYQSGLSPNRTSLNSNIIRSFEVYNITDSSVLATFGEHSPTLSPSSGSVVGIVTLDKTKTYKIRMKVANNNAAIVTTTFLSNYTITISEL